MMNHYENAGALLAQFESLRETEPKIRALAAAQKLGVSEGELLAARVGREAIRLRDEPQAILQALEPLGEVMALTRNEFCVHERKGVYANAEFNEHAHSAIGLFVNPDIDLRLFMEHWRYCFAVCEATAGGPQRKSLQFYDKSGVALHKVYVMPKSNEAAYDALVENFKADAQPTSIDIEPYKPAAPNKADAEVDWGAFRKEWEALQDTHDFYLLLRKFKIGREQSFRKIGSDFAYPLDNGAARRMLDMAGERQCEIMVFVGNRGCIQIHTGPVKNLKEAGAWYNVLDKKFHFHLREDKIASSWITKKPTEDGIVTALELFDAAGELIVTFFGKRKPGIPELELWREIVTDISTKEAAHVA